MPAGVHEANPGSPKAIEAKESLVTPSTSFWRDDRLERSPLVDGLGNRVLEKNAIDLFVRRQVLNGGNHFLGRCSPG